MGALVGASDHGTTKSLYVHDPDGLEFEVCWIVPAAQLSLVGERRAPTLPLDLDDAITTFGASTVGGLGISWPAS